MQDYKWRPVEPLSAQDREIDIADMASLAESWNRSQQHLTEISPRQLGEFKRRLVRRLSIETGILERIYDLDRGTTEALVSHGFVQDLVSRASTDIEPAKLVDILQDQQQAIELVMDSVAGQRKLTKGYLHELHLVLTRHQDTTFAVDQFGTRMEIPLLKGQFKRLPNNPRRPDGSVHEYCPPLQVDSEIEQLIAWLEAYTTDGVEPVLTAAWFHHRFTQIHPYQDGNGRLVRTLTTLILLRAGLLPLVVDRDQRVEYIGALESADGGSLAGLAQLFAKLERAAILQALSVDVDAAVQHQESVTEAVIGSLKTKFDRRRQVQRTELLKVNSVAVALRSSALAFLERELPKIRSIGEGVVVDPAAPGGADRGTGHWYRAEVVRTANEHGKFANLREDHYFAKGSVRIAEQRLVFVVSLHHVGREISGVMEATAFAQLIDPAEPGASSKDFVACSVEPFVFTYLTSPDVVVADFERWLDGCLAVALKEFGDRL